jgi:hypothetical protein
VPTAAPANIEALKDTVEKKLYDALKQVMYKVSPQCREKCACAKTKRRGTATPRTSVLDACGLAQQFYAR